MPTPRSGSGVAAASNGKIYAVGGGGSNGYLATLEEYDPATNTWSTKAPMATARAGLALAAATNGKLYAVSGSSNDFGYSPSRLEEYDPATNTWAVKVPMPAARYGVALAGATNGKLYAVGGYPAGTCCQPVTSVEEYDPAANTWATKASMPTGRYNLRLAASDNGKLYAVGGTNGSDTLVTVEEYDPATNSWARKSPCPLRVPALDWRPRATALSMWLAVPPLLPQGCP